MTTIVKMIYCPRCGKQTEHNKALDWKSLLLGVVTCGLSLLRVRTYRNRCVACGSENADPGDIHVP